MIVLLVIGIVHRWWKSLASKFKGLLGNYIWPGHASTHSFRKGSGTYSQSGTTCPPSVSSTATGSLGHVLDLYWHIPEPGDCYLGWVLAGLDPNDASFGARDRKNYTAAFRIRFWGVSVSCRYSRTSSVGYLYCFLLIGQYSVIQVLF